MLLPSGVFFNFVYFQAKLAKEETEIREYQEKKSKEEEAKRVKEEEDRKRKSEDEEKERLKREEEEKKAETELSERLERETKIESEKDISDLSPKKELLTPKSSPDDSAKTPVFPTKVILVLKLLFLLSVAVMILKRVADLIKAFIE
jgi:hypothetical protein